MEHKACDENPALVIIPRPFEHHGPDDCADIYFAGINHFQKHEKTLVGFTLKSMELVSRKCSNNTDLFDARPVVIVPLDQACNHHADLIDELIPIGKSILKFVGVDDQALDNLEKESEFIEKKMQKEIDEGGSAIMVAVHAVQKEGEEDIVYVEEEVSSWVGGAWTSVKEEVSGWFTAGWAWVTQYWVELL